MKILTALVFAVFASASLATADDLPKFEAATLKQAPPPTGDSYPITLGVINGTRLKLNNVTLSDCLKFAYGLVSDDQLTGPDWLWSKSFLYDIVAVVPPNAPREKILLMTQSLLAERLKVVVHHEQKEMKYLALVAAKGGAKMPPADTNTERNNSAGKGRLTGNRASMALVASLLSRLEQQIVVDRTDLTGEFEVNLRWNPGSGGTGAASDESTAPSLFTAVQEQLGLRLEPRKGPLDIIVVDSAQRIPAEN